MRTRGTQLPQAHRRRRFLDLLGAPPAICLAHVARGFDRRDKLEGDVADADDANNDSCDGANDATAEKEATEEEVEDTSSGKGEEEWGVMRHLGRDLEFEQSNGQAKNDHVNGENDGPQGDAEVEDTANYGQATNCQVDNAENIRELHRDMRGTE